MAEAHTGYDTSKELTGVEHILHSLAGGAAEMACGMSPTNQLSEFGRYPSSMYTDLCDLRDQLRDSWEDTHPVLPTCFEEIVHHFRGKSAQIWGVAQRFLDKRELTSNEMDFSFIDREALLQKLARALGITL